ncbi:MAG: isochorismatase family protein [Syntrophaceae bacterium]
MSAFLNRDDCFLLVVDIQQRLYDAMEAGFRETFLRNSIILIEAAKACGIPIVVSEQYPGGLGDTIDAVGQHITGIPRMEKLSFSCRRDRAIRERIDSLGRGTAIVCGIEAHVCVMQTAFDLMATGYPVVVSDDAVCSRRVHDRLSALDSMARSGALVYSTEAIAFMLIEKAGTELFRQLSPLFREDQEDPSLRP